MPWSPRKPESGSSRVFETHLEDAKPTGIHRYINILAISVPIVVGLVLVLLIAHSLHQPANSSTPTSTSPSAEAPAPVPTANAAAPANATPARAVNPTPSAPAPKPVAAQPVQTPAPAVVQPAAATIPQTTSPAKLPSNPPAPASSVSADSIVNLSAVAANALKISGSTAQVPPLAELAHTVGLVVVDAIISKTGTVQEVHVVSGPNLLQSAALDAAKTFRYKPYLVNGRPVRVHTQIVFDFVASPR
jgi:periplasmic protein TonB